MMSNSNTDFVKQNFPEEKYSIKVITAKRSINSKNPSSKTRELIIKNY
jgi:site-specific DNA-adenine methylase